MVDCQLLFLLNFKDPRIISGITIFARPFFLGDYRSFVIPSYIRYDRIALGNWGIFTKTAGAQRNTPGTRTVGKKRATSENYSTKRASSREHAQRLSDSK